MYSNKIGSCGEKAAAKYMINKSFEIKATNYRSEFGEIDIIAQNYKYIVFIEVKTRKENSLSLPVEAVNKKKQSKIIKTAASYLLKNNIDLQPRFDVIEVIFKNNNFIIKNHIENAFFQEDDYAAF